MSDKTIAGAGQKPCPGCELGIAIMALREESCGSVVVGQRLNCRWQANYVMDSACIDIDVGTPPPS
jgi:hypothetical protein